MSDTIEIKVWVAIPHAGGIAFRVWAPHAQRVSVIGSFNGWDGDKHPMQRDENSAWYADVAVARVGDQYKFLLTTAQGELKRIDPYAREVTNSVGNAIVHDRASTGRGMTSSSRRGTRSSSMSCMSHVQREGRQRTRQIRRSIGPLGASAKARRQCGSDHAIAQFAGERSWATIPRISSRLRPTTEAPWRSSALSRAPTSTTSR